MKFIAADIACQRRSVQHGADEKSEQRLKDLGFFETATVKSVPVAPRQDHLDVSRFRKSPETFR